MSEHDRKDRVKLSSLTKYIRQDLMEKIDSGSLDSAGLSLQALATNYNVSITPLRTAINELIHDGFIIKLPNRRLQVNPWKAGMAKEFIVAPPPPTTQDWDEVLIKEVVYASLGKRSSYLREDMLSKKLDVGRTIIRQALSRFVGAGLIEHIPRRGWYVHPLRIEDMRSYLVVREMMEIKALKLARENIDPADLLTIRDRTTGIDMPGLDNSIHDYIIAKSGNRYICQFFQQYVARYYKELFYFAAPETSEVEEMALQHIGIIDELLARRWSQAKALLSRHIKNQAFVLGKLLDKEHIESDINSYDRRQN